MLVNKQHALDESYVPNNMVVINEPTGRKLDSSYVNMLDQEAYINFKLMQIDAHDLEGFEIYVDSSYRSYDYQKRVYDKSVAENGEEYTKKYVAIPGTSEHQTGLAIDVIARRDNVMIENPKEDDPELVWCMNNCHRYGFILRYPKGKEGVTGYDFEPWHFRYVGKDLALEMKESNIKTLEEYHYLKRVKEASSSR